MKKIYEQPLLCLVENLNVESIMSISFKIDPGDEHGGWSDTKERINEKDTKEWGSLW